MSTQLAIDIVWKAFGVGFSLALPILAASLIVGLLISIFQAITQIHEMTLTFVPKIIAVALVLALFLPWMIKSLVNYTTYLYTSIPQIIGG